MPAGTRIGRSNSSSLFSPCVEDAFDSLGGQIGAVRENDDSSTDVFRDRL